MTARKVIALVLVVALLGAGAYMLRRMERQDQNHMRDLYTEIEPLQRERDALVQERDSLELNYAVMMRDVATVQLLFRELKQDLFSTVYPIMRDRGITGVLGLTSESFPGLFGLISVNQYNRLVMDGWDGCYIYSNHSNAFVLGTWLSNMEERVDYNAMPRPTAIYFPNNSYMEEYNQVLIEHGIQTVVTDAPDGRSATVTDLTGELWFTGAMPWNYTGVSSDTELLSRTDGANLTFTISFSNLWDAYEKESFTATMDSWSSLLVTEDPLAEQEAAKPAAEDELLKPLLRVCSYAGAKQAHLEAVQNNAVYQAEFLRRQTELDERIAELDEQIRALYDQWQK